MNDIRAAATRVLAYWDYMDAIPDDGRENWVPLKAEMDARMDALRATLDGQPEYAGGPDGEPAKGTPESPLPAERIRGGIEALVCASYDAGRYAHGLMTPAILRAERVVYDIVNTLSEHAP